MVREQYTARARLPHGRSGYSSRAEDRLNLAVGSCAARRLCLTMGGMAPIKVHVLQVDQNPENIAELAAGVEAGRTVEDWQMPKGSTPGDLVVWYAAGRQQYIARGWVEAPPVKVEEGPGPYRGLVAGMQWIDPVDRKKVIRDCGFNGGLQSYQTVRDQIAAEFLRSLGLLM